MSELRERVKQAQAILGPMGHTSITLDDSHDYTVEDLFDDILALLSPEPDVPGPLEETGDIPPAATYPRRDR